MDKIKRVLIVEDSPVNLKAITSLLNSLGFRYDVATDGEQALRQSRCNEYALVLMDLRLPRQDGFSVAQAMRCDGNSVPIVALSAYPMNSDWHRCVEAGIDDYLCKGFRKDELENVIALWGNSDIVKPMFETRMQR